MGTVTYFARWMSIRVCQITSARCQMYILIGVLANPSCAPPVAWRAVPLYTSLRTHKSLKTAVLVAAAVGDRLILPSFSLAATV